MTRLTEDLHLVSQSEDVWEVMYRYINAEVSIAEPEKRMVKQIPVGVKIWVHYSACRLHCGRLNNGTEDKMEKIITYKEMPSAKYDNTPIYNYDK